MAWSYHTDYKSWDYLRALHKKTTNVFKITDDLPRWEAAVEIRDDVRALIAKKIPGDIDHVKNIKTPGGRPELILTHTFVKSVYKYEDQYTFSEAQLLAWEIAFLIVSTFQIELYGPSEHSNPDIRRLRSTNTTDLKLSEEKWKNLVVETAGDMQLVVDHIMAFDINVPPSGNRSYEIQKSITPIAKSLAMDNAMTVWGITQWGVTYAREFRSTGETKGSDGGDFWERELDQSWLVQYDDRSTPDWILLHKPSKTRLGTHPSIAVPIDMYSGAFLGDSVPMDQVI